MRVSLMKVETINSAVRHLRYYNDEYIYAATDNEVNSVHRSVTKPTDYNVNLNIICRYSL